MSRPTFNQCDLRPEPCRSPFAEIVEKSACGIVVLDHAGSVHYANEAAERLLGSDVVGKTLPWAGIDRSEFVILGGEHDLAATEVRIVEMDWDGGAARLAFLRDITDRRVLEDALKKAIVCMEEEKSKSEAIIAAIGDGLTIQDTSFRIQYQNQIHKDLMGEHVGETCYAAYAHRDGVCDDCPLQVSLLRGITHTVERRLTCGWGTLCFEITASPLRDASGRIIAGIEVVRNITERKEAEEKLRFMSSYDILTGLHNRYYFQQELNRLEQCRHFPVSVVMADVDDLKAINDRLGHAAGDELLRHAAALFKEAFRAEDVVARIGGDEFAVLLLDTGEEAAEEIVIRIREILCRWNETHDTPINLSLGMATAECGIHLFDALKMADQRMYQDKLTRTGRPPRRIPAATDH